MAGLAKTALFCTILHPQKRAFLLAYCETGQLRASCIAAHISHQNHYYWMKHDAAYVAAFEEAQSIATETLEDEAIRRARDGVKRSIFYKDQEIGEELVYSDTLLIFLLKGAKPTKYRERYEHSGEHGGPVQIEVVYTSPPKIVPSPSALRVLPEPVQIVYDDAPNGTHEGRKRRRELIRLMWYT